MESLCEGYEYATWSAYLYIPETERVYEGAERIDVIAYCEARRDFMNLQFALFYDFNDETIAIVTEAVETGDFSSGLNAAKDMEEIARALAEQIQSFPNPKPVEQVNKDQASAFLVYADAFAYLINYFEYEDANDLDKFEELGYQFGTTFNNASDYWHEVAYRYNLDPFHCER